MRRSVRRTDVALAAGLLALAEVEVAIRGVGGDAGWAYAFWAVAALAVLGRRRWPVAFAAWAIAVFAIAPIADLEPPAGAAAALYQPLALFGLGAYVRDAGHATVAAVLGTVATVLAMALLQAGGWFGDAPLDHYVRAASILAAAAAGGVVLRDRTEALRRARRRAAAAAAAAPSAVDRALSHERARIARELHAVVTACVRAVLDEVGAARSALVDRSGAAAPALLRARLASRQAMAEMRRMLALLRAETSAVAGARPPARAIERDDVRVRARARLESALEPAALEALAERVRLAGGRLRVPRWARGRRLAVEPRLAPPDAIAASRRRGRGRWAPLLRRQGMPLLVLVVGVAEALLAHGRPAEFYGDAGVPLRVAGAVLTALAFLPRRRWPLATIVAVGLLMILRTAWLGDAYGLNLTAYLTAFLAGAYVRPVALSALAGAVPVVCGVLAVVIGFDGNWEIYPLNLLLFFATMTSAAWLTGFGGRRRLAEAEELHALTAAEERRAAQAAEEAVAAERLRVARELHDLVGHGLTSITLQSAVAAQLLDVRPREAAAAVDAVEAVGRETLGELHRLLAALDGRREAEAPQLARLPELVRRAAGDGLAVRLELDGDVHGVPPGQGGAAYRIVQEALTNARKHGGAGTVTARVDCRRDRVAIEVASATAGAARPRDGAAAAGDGAWSGGHGLLGMRERVRVYDGRLVAAPGDGGRSWVVRAELPLD